MFIIFFLFFAFGLDLRIEFSDMFFFIVLKGKFIAFKKNRHYFFLKEKFKEMSKVYDLTCRLVLLNMVLVELCFTR